MRLRYAIGLIPICMAAGKSHAQASPFAHLGNGALRGLREVNVYTSLSPSLAPNIADVESLLGNAAVQLLGEGGLTARLRPNTGPLFIYPALYLEFFVSDAIADSVSILASIVLIEGSQLLRNRAHTTSITWGLRTIQHVDREAIGHEAFQLTTALIGSFLRERGCANGQLRLCSRP